MIAFIANIAMQLMRTSRGNPQSETKSNIRPVSTGSHNKRKAEVPYSLSPWARKIRYPLTTCPAGSLYRSTEPKWRTGMAEKRKLYPRGFRCLYHS